MYIDITQGRFLNLRLWCSEILCLLRATNLWVQTYISATFWASQLLLEASWLRKTTTWPADSGWRTFPNFPNAKHVKALDNCEMLRVGIVMYCERRNINSDLDRNNVSWLYDSSLYRDWRTAKNEQNSGTGALWVSWRSLRARCGMLGTVEASATR